MLAKLLGDFLKTGMQPWRIMHIKILLMNLQVLYTELSNTINRYIYFQLPMALLQGVCKCFCEWTLWGLCLWTVHFLCVSLPVRGSSLQTAPGRPLPVWGVLLRIASHFSASSAWCALLCWSQVPVLLRSSRWCLSFFLKLASPDISNSLQEKFY